MTYFFRPLLKDMYIGHTNICLDQQTLARSLVGQCSTEISKFLFPNFHVVFSCQMLPNIHYMYYIYYLGDRMQDNKDRNGLQFFKFDFVQAVRSRNRKIADLKKLWVFFSRYFVSFLS